MTTKPFEIYIVYDPDDERALDTLESPLNRLRPSPVLRRLPIAAGDLSLTSILGRIQPDAYVVLLCSKKFKHSHAPSSPWLDQVAEMSVVVVSLSWGVKELPAPLQRSWRIDIDPGAPATGQASLVQFFEREDRPVPRRGPGPGLLRNATRNEIRRVAQRCLDEADFYGFLWDAQIERNDIPGSSLSERLVHLLQQVELEDQLGLFMRFLEDERGKCVKAQLARLRQETSR